MKLRELVVRVLLDGEIPEIKKRLNHLEGQVRGLGHINQKEIEELDNLRDLTSSREKLYFKRFKRKKRKVFNKKKC